MRRSLATRYLHALYREIDEEPKVCAKTIFLGGGTPNAYDSAEIVALTEALRRHFPHPEGAEHEISIEVNPELVAADDFAQYAQAGINRVSIGVQSFDPGEIETLGRKHTPEQVHAVVAQARRAGIASLSLDLIFAVPGQSTETWRASLSSAIALGVDHVSAYGLTVEEHTPYALWQAREPQAFFDDGREADLYTIAIDSLERAGFEHYEISNFAKAGHRSRHNANYWANGEYVGLGVGAASYRSGTRSVHTRSIGEYIGAVMNGKAIPGESETLEGLRRVGEAIMLALRTAQGIDLGLFSERYDIDVTKQYSAPIAEYTDAGLLERHENFLRLTRRGRFVANDICGAFIPFE